MNCLRSVLVVLGLVGAFVRAQVPQTAADEEVIHAEAVEPGDIHYDYVRGVGVATNRFLLRFRDATLTADRGRFNQVTGEVEVEGEVVIQRDNQVWRADRLAYNFRSQIIGTERFRAGRWPVYAAGSGLTFDLTNRVYTASNAYVTSDDVADPGFRIRARQLVVAPGRYFEAHDAVLYVGGLPVFYFPYYRRNLDPRANRFNVTPGYRSRHGLFALGSYDWFLGERLGGTAHLDYRLKRGAGGGLDVRYELGAVGQGEFRSYYLHDLEADAVRDFQGEDVGVDADRYRFALLHRAEPLTNLTVTVALRRQSDAFVLRDFFESEYRDNTQSPSFIEADRRWANWSLSVLTRPQLNDFFETVERLPDVKLSAARQALGPLPLYYEGESSAGFFRRRFAEGSLTNDYGALRADTFHQVLWPSTFFGWLNATPRVGGRFTYYGDTDGEGSVLTDRTRGVVNTGMEVSFKASRLWAQATNRFFQIDGLRHIVQPAVNYAYVPEPSALPPELPQFDTEWPSLRLLPNLFPDYHAIDAIDSRNVMRLGLRNKLQTKRRGQVDPLIDWDVYTDWRIERTSGQTTFADVFSDLDVKPWAGVTLSSELRVDPEAGRFRVANHMLTLEPGATWSWSVGHRYLREDPAVGFGAGHNLLLSTFYYRLNENWGVRLSHHYEISDRTLEEQYYTVYRDFRSWTGALTFRVRDDRLGSLDYGVAFTFQLKAFPRFAAGDDRQKPALLLGY